MTSTLFSQGTHHGSRRYSANLSVTYLKQNMVDVVMATVLQQSRNCHRFAMFRINTWRRNIENNRKHTSVFYPLMTAMNEISKIPNCSCKKKQVPFVETTGRRQTVRGVQVDGNQHCNPTNMFLHYYASNIHIKNLDDWSKIPLNCSKRLITSTPPKFNIASKKLHCQ